MEFSNEELQMSMDAIASTIRKTEKVVQTLSAKNSNHNAQINTANQRLQVYTSALRLIDEAMGTEGVSNVNEEDRLLLQEILPPIQTQIEGMLNKFKVGTAQHTLSIRRIRAFEIVLELAK